MNQDSASRTGIRVAACGDVAGGHKPPESAFTHVRDALRNADIRFAQVEKLYTDRGTYQESSGAANLEVRQPPHTAAAFATVPFNVLSLASNHTGDWGPEAVEDTVATFRKLAIPTIGAGRNIGEARKPVFFEKDGLRVAFFGYCSVVLPQFWASDDRAGCAPMRASTFYEPIEYQPGSPPQIITVPHQGDLEALVDDVSDAKRSADLVVVSLHWGLHFTSRPQEYQPVVAHAAIDAGACAILGHHAHQQQGIEIYNGGVIFYSLGNLACHRRGGGYALCMPGGTRNHREVYSLEPDPGHYYDYRRHWNEGGIAYIDLDRDGVRQVEYLPTYMNEKGQPEIVTPGDPQFETTRGYLEWLGGQIRGGVTKIASRGERYMLYERDL
ncbi:MAG: CapA family protein [Betaproteobacteria bacterium]|nr:CapA family protein [Betaproteobacteria bacterium]